MMFLRRALLFAAPLLLAPAAQASPAGEPTHEIFRAGGLHKPVPSQVRHVRRHRHHTARADRRGHRAHRHAGRPVRAGRDAAHMRGAHTSTAGLPAPLVNALAQVKGACAGFRIVSTFRPGAVVRGTGRPSLHASHRAADFAVTRWRCAYAALRGFPGGMTTDPGRVGHVHLSWAPGSHEWGARFAHGGHGRHHRSRYAVAR